MILSDLYEGPLMKSATIRFTRCLAGAAIALACALPARASIVFSFALDADQTGHNENIADPNNPTGTGRYSPTGGNVVQVPASGGTYYIDVVVTSDNSSVSKVGFQAGYYGAMSTVLDSFNSLQGGVVVTTYSSVNPNGMIGSDLNHNNLFGSSLGGGNDNAQIGSVQDNNGDGHADLGGVTGGPNNVGPPKPQPWWVRPNSGASPTYANATTSGKFLTGSVGAGSTLNTRTEVIGYFVVTIAPHFGASNFFTDSLAYNPVLGPSSITNTYTWADVSGGATTLRNGNLATQAGDNNVLLGTGIIFQTNSNFVPEPGTFALIGLGGVGLVASRRSLRRRGRTSFAEAESD
jgi:hypothetical protein